MQITVKDVTNTQYTSPDMTKQEIIDEFEKAGGDADDARRMYRQMIDMFGNWPSLTKITVNVGSKEEPEELIFNPANLIWVRVRNAIEEWEDE